MAARNTLAFQEAMLMCVPLIRSKQPQHRATKVN